MRHIRMRDACTCRVVALVIFLNCHLSIEKEHPYKKRALHDVSKNGVVDNKFQCGPSHLDRCDDPIRTAFVKAAVTMSRYCHSLILAYCRIRASSFMYRRHSHLPNPYYLTKQPFWEHFYYSLLVPFLNIPSQLRV